MTVLSLALRFLIFPKTFALSLVVPLTQLETLLLRLLVAWLLVCLAVRQEPHRMGMGRAATRQSTICLTVGMQVLLYPGKHISHAASESNYLMTSHWQSSKQQQQYLNSPINLNAVNFFSFQKRT